MESIKQGAKYVSETIQGKGDEASKEANKQVAKDGDAPVGTRASAAKDAFGDKVEQHGHESKADVHKEAAKH
ncbi:glucose-repressible protein Grg1 [Calycina marina]|uniref:Glucose-repressible protein Grg1 n=1 Tax=Calycina marina TaxID=1763456 RepID=A0A9P8CHL0_9HELO|nr:glucose-repressible protein Grg1 [Calycina marina]